MSPILCTSNVTETSSERYCRITSQHEVPGILLRASNQKCASTSDATSRRIDVLPFQLEGTNQRLPEQVIGGIWCAFSERGAIIRNHIDFFQGRRQDKHRVSCKGQHCVWKFTSHRTRPSLTPFNSSPGRYVISSHSSHDPSLPSLFVEFEHVPGLWRLPLPLGHRAKEEQTVIGIKYGDGCSNGDDNRRGFKLQVSSSRATGPRFRGASKRSSVMGPRNLNVASAPGSVTYRVT